MSLETIFKREIIMMFSLKTCTKTNSKAEVPKNCISNKLRCTKCIDLIKIVILRH